MQRVIAVDRDEVLQGSIGAERLAVSLLEFLSVLSRI
jgi:hypothetical protein